MAVGRVLRLERRGVLVRRPSVAASLGVAAALANAVVYVMVIASSIVVHLWLSRRRAI